LGGSSGCEWRRCCIPAWLVIITIIVPEAAIPIEWRIPAGLDARIKEGFRWTMMISRDTLYSDVRFLHRQMAETGAGKKLTNTAGAFLTAKCAQ